MSKIRIIYMGTPEFAAKILTRLIDLGKFEILAVVTAPDKPAGRGRAISTSAVKTIASENDLLILQPTNLKDTSFIKELENLAADLFVVIAFRMLPEVVWAMPPEGTINLHASLLPQYRGAAPINWAVINGETETGVSSFFIEKEIDTGAIIERRKISIGENESVGQLYERLLLLGGETIISTILKIQSGETKPILQESVNDEQKFKPAPKIFKEDCKIDFKHSVLDVHNFCRGLDPYPGAWCVLYSASNEKRTFKIFNTRVTSMEVNGNNSLKTSIDGILMPCSDYYLLVKEIQPAGKRRMSSGDFQAGNQIAGIKILGE